MVNSSSSAKFYRMNNKKIRIVFNRFEQQEFMDRFSDIRKNDKGNSEINNNARPLFVQLIEQVEFFFQKKNRKISFVNIFYFGESSLNLFNVSTMNVVHRWDRYIKYVHNLLYL